MKDTLIVCAIVWTVAGAVVGLLSGVNGLNGGDGCHYQNVASRTNPGYAIVCELLRKRW
jgi:hypothetical protein